MRTRKLLAAVLSVAPLLVLVTPLPAVANPATSIALTDLPACGTTEIEDNGGWTGHRKFVTQQMQSDALLRPTFMTLRELCKVNNTTIGLPYTADAPPNVQAPDYNPTYTTSSPFLVTNFQTGLQTRWTVQCLDSTGAPLQMVAYNSTTQSSVVQTASPWVKYGTLSAGVTSSCVRLVSLTTDVAWRVDQYQAPGTLTGTSVTWSAERSIQNVTYDGEPAPPGVGPLCAPETLEWLQCDSYRAKDAAAWSDTCGEASNASYYGVEWPGSIVAFGEVDIGAWLTWHAACLFVPHPDFGGFDRNYVIADALEMSPNAALFTTFDQLGAPFAAGGTCGSIVQGDVPFIGEINIDSCEWTWAHPVRSVLGIGVALMFGWWAAVFSINSILSLFSKGQKPVTPVLA